MFLGRVHAAASGLRTAEHGESNVGDTTEKYTLSVVFRGSRGNRRGHRLRSMPPPEQKCPAAGTTPSGNGPKQKQPAAGTAPSGNGTNRNSPQPEQHRARTSRNKNSPQPEQHRAGTSRNRNGPRPERHRAGTGRTETARTPQEGGGPSFGRHAQGIYRSATRCRGVLSGTTGESSSSSSSSMSVTSRPVSTPSV